MGMLEEAEEGAAERRAQQEKDIENWLAVQNAYAAALDSLSMEFRDAARGSNLPTERLERSLFRHDKGWGVDLQKEGSDWGSGTIFVFENGGWSWAGRTGFQGAFARRDRTKEPKFTYESPDSDYVADYRHNFVQRLARR